MSFYKNIEVILKNILKGDTMIEYYILIFISVNVISFIMMAIDKRKAKKRLTRISEDSFLVLSALGGFVGIFIAGSLFRHKTIKRSFQLKILFGLMIHILIVYLGYKYIK